MSGDRDDGVQARAKLFRRFTEYVPHNAALGVRVDELTDGRARIRLPYRDELVGDPETGVIHGGAITTLMDATCGAAVFMRLTERIRIATLDLRIDYLKPATPPRAVIADAECYKLTRNVAFVRCLAYHGDPDDPGDPIASAAGTFMLVRPMAAPDAKGDGGGDA